MPECILDKAKNMFGDSGRNSSRTIGFIVRTEGQLAPVSVDRRSGQVIQRCKVEGCNTELEVYPDASEPNRYHVAEGSLGAARLVCKLVREGDSNGAE